jgi:hypothetical protein
MLPTKSEYFEHYVSIAFKYLNKFNYNLGRSDQRLELFKFDMKNSVYDSVTLCIIKKELMESMRECLDLSKICLNYLAFLDKSSPIVTVISDHIDMCEKEYLDLINEWNTFIEDKKLEEQYLEQFGAGEEEDYFE